MQIRDLNDLRADLLGREAVEATARRPVANIVATVLLFLWPIGVVGGILMMVLGRNEPTLPATGAVMIGVGVLLLAVALLLRRHARTAPWHVWRLDPQGITVAGVGPLPWEYVGPPERRLVRSAYSDGQELGWCLPLTQEGIAWMQTLDDGCRQVFDPSLRPRLRIVGRRRPQVVRLMPMRDADMGDWVAVVGEAWERFGGR